MTKEPIIVDDVDISGCKYLDITKSGRAQCMDYKRESNRADCKCNNHCYYKQLKRKEEEFNELKVKLLSLEQGIEIAKEIDLYWVNKLKADNEKMEKGYIELTEIVSPYIDDFTGYNEELKGFDIVLCVKELMQQFEQLQVENEKLRQYKASKQASYETMQKECNDAKNEVKQLKAENKKLKEKLDDFEFMYDSLCK